MRAQQRAQRTHSRGTVAACVLLGLSSACASVSSPDKDAGFRFIQVQEARLERARARAFAATEACESAVDARSAVSALCERAHELADADALARCRAAEARARAIEERLASRCGKEEPA